MCFWGLEEQLGFYCFVGKLHLSKQADFYVDTHGWSFRNGNKTKTTSFPIGYKNIETALWPWLGTQGPWTVGPSSFQASVLIILATPFLREQSCVM